MTIQYTNCQIISADAVGDSPVPDSLRTDVTFGAQPASPQAKAQAAKE
jgi:hypothetical protein